MTEKRIARAEHYERTVGMVPPAIVAMFDMDETFGQRYTDIRELIYRERREGLPLTSKELMLTMLDIATDNLGGARVHLRAARRAGATKEQFTEMALISWLVLGIGSWGKVTFHLWNEWDELS